MHKILRTICATLLALAAGSAAEESEAIKIGVLYPLTGSGAVLGVPALMGHDMAVEEINARGGIEGRPVVSIARDSKVKPAVAAAAARELITREEVDVLIGGLSSAEGLALSEVARQEKVVYIATIPKTVQMTNEKFHKYVFRTAANTDTEARAMARTSGQIGIEKICQIQFDYAYGHDLAAGFIAALPEEAPGAEIVLDLKVKLGTADFNPYIAQIMASDCDGVASGLWGANFINLAQQGKPFGLFDKVKFVSGGEIGAHEIAGKMKGNYPDNVWSNSYELWYHDHVPQHKTFHDKLARRQGTRETSSWAVLGYIGVQFFEAAAARAGAVDGEALISALEGLTVETPVGSRTLDPRTHEANTGQFWGPMTKTEQYEFRIMDPVTYIASE